MQAEIVKENWDDAYQGHHTLVKLDDEFFVVSSVKAYSGFETLVFPATPEGEVIKWLEVAGGRGMGQARAIMDLERVMNDRPA